MIGRKKVLMLGWEYPPFLTGGLGTACHGLANALKEYVDLTMIIPKYDQAYVDAKLNILGLNKFESTFLEQNKPEPTFRTFFIEAGIDFSPYPVGIAFEVTEDVTPIDERKALFGSDEPYGPQILAKVHRYREMVLELASSLDFDIIHAHDWLTFPAALALKELTGKPLVVHIHSLETDRIGEQHDFSGNAVFEIERSAMQQADRIVPVSEFTKKCAIRNYGIQSAKFFPVYNAMEETVPYKLGKEGDDKLVLFLGRITFQKGPEFMVETAHKLTSKYKKVKFVVAGTGDKLAQLQAMVSQRGLDERFIFTGFLPKSAVRDVLAQTDVYFMPSVSEPFGLSALEAAQFDVPCIVSTQSGVSEVLPNSLQADFWDTDKFANYIFALLNYQGLRQDVIDNTKQDITTLTWDESAKDVMLVYQGL